jgi:23S rRNA A2030 N6-methylase RlmJ
MPNRHFGEIGDIWKHLPLAAILDLEIWDRYFETHSGSGLYSLAINDPQQNDRWWKIEYGVLNVWNAVKYPSSFLSQSKYGQLLFILSRNGMLEWSPGSPWIALKCMKNEVIKEFMFCDVDPESLKSIEEVAKPLDLPQTVMLNLCLKDGLQSVWKRIQEEEHSLKKTLLFLDPYDIFAKDVEKNQLDSVFVFQKAVRLQMPTVLWYGFDSSSDRQKKLNAIKQSIQESGNVYYTEIVFDQLDKIKINPGIKGGCVMVLANLRSTTISAVLELGKALENIYQNSVLVDGSSGRIQFKYQKL